METSFSSSSWLDPIYPFFANSSIAFKPTPLNGTWTKMECRIEGEARERRQQVLDLHALDRWEEILNIYQSDMENQNTEIWDRGLLWLRPSERSLQFIAEQLQNLGLKKILSIGCGSGLFEWLISRVTGLHVEGIEVDAKWWDSPYSPPCFLPKNLRHFVIPEKHSDEMIPKDVALLFCYFNDEGAYNDYLKRYLGNCIIVAGPAGVGDKFPPDHLLIGDSKELAKKGRHCNPKPFSVKEPWVLVKAMAVNTSPGDYIAVYTR
ncbi:hypothetical protein J437_LFUL003177 [Ladona fulva]|uniref:Uncharacterized protein n=1 Tax=Ladona fulva TaxID=123851 RepID=A0A8K0JXU6_LADFU|nr:hypothetical protein J437_LFUL003177 [Ladona fulva]